MKNIEKYPNTKDALDAYNKLNSRELFETWLELEFEETREQSLLEAADAVIDEWYHPQQNATCLNYLCEKIVDLKKAEDYPAYDKENNDGEETKEEDLKNG